MDQLLNLRPSTLQFTCIMSFDPYNKQPYETDIIKPIFEMKKLRLKEFKKLA